MEQTWVPPVGGSRLFSRDYVSLNFSFPAIMTIAVTTHYVSPSDSSSPALAFQVTSMVNSYMVWGGIAQGTPEEVESAASNGRLAQDWACAMPPSKVLYLLT